MRGSRRLRVRAERRGLKMAGAVTLAASILTGATLTWTGHVQPSQSAPLTALLPAVSETRSSGVLRTSSAASINRLDADAISAKWKRILTGTQEAVEDVKGRAAAAKSRPAKKTTGIEAPAAPTTEPSAPTTDLTTEPSAPTTSTSAPTTSTSAPTASTSAPSTTAPSAPSAPAGGSIDSLTAAQIYKKGPYRQPDNVSATKVAELERAGRTADAALIREISSQPIAMWLNAGLNGDALAQRLTHHASRAAAEGTTPVFVTYAVPGRDCGGHSAGGMDPAGYLEWNRAIARHLTGTGAVIIVEPDSIAMLGGAACAAYESGRLPLLKQSVEILASAGLVVYLDAGTSNWAPAETIANRLKQAGIDRARGFFTNVSSFMATDREIQFADRVNSLLGGNKHYVIDTSRNGAPTNHWCNPSGAALGENPRVVSSGALDALLWVKPAGESDGTCNGGPAAGQWFESYALDLVRNRR